MHPQPEPLACGEPARLILAIIRDFPLSLGYDRNAIIQPELALNTIDVFSRAMRRAEHEVLEHARTCTVHEAHQTVDALGLRSLALHHLAWEAKKALGETNAVEGMWLR
jgi:hypothetical protein